MVENPGCACEVLRYDREARARDPPVYVQRMWRASSSVLVCVCVTALITSCGSPGSPVSQIRRSFERLQVALHDRDAAKVCELLFPFGQHQPSNALAADLRKLQTEAGRTSYKRSLAQCEPVLAQHPRDFAGYERVFGGATLGSVAVRGDTARVAFHPKNDKATILTFVNAAGEWRLLIGVQ